MQFIYSWAQTSIFYFIAFILGALVGFSELISRYTWGFEEIRNTRAGWFYLILNGLVAAVAYRAAVDWNFVSGLEGKSEVWRVVLVSILAMAFLRSSFANIRIGNKEVGAGLVSFIEIFLRRAEGALDHQLALTRWNKITSEFQGLTYAATRDYCTAMSQGLLRSFTKADFDVFQGEISKIDALDVDDATKIELFAFRLAEKTDLDLVVAFAKKAKVKLAAVSELAARQAQEKREILTEAKKLLG